ncbi:hypothetical protein L486_07999 [Kwoniella mangroviensis CBS 10435]|uniref:Protein CPL1-like domain-containing protein n=1 Tax=Kwoniella mangroviensis CBS 10435 TaxID=1331196 RepID=A0A1B9IG93_9TREE|nr:hypothetical protein L486_07999 [Kwoniella mangroviensis CBS 10435]
MHIATFLSPLLFLTLPSLVVSDPTPTTPNHELDIRGYGKCYDLKTRDPQTCKCYPEYEEPKDHGGYWKKRQEADAEAEAEAKKGGYHYEECVCPDYPNTELDDGYGGGGWEWKGHGGGGHPKCVCKGDHQTYNPKTRECECDDGYQPWTPPNHYKRGEKKGGNKHKLICKPGPTQSAGPGGYKRSPSLHEAIKMRKQDERGVENLLGCKDEEKACESHGSWKCVDVSSLLWSCGACPGEGVDCGAVPGVSEVSCQRGHCVIESCRRGFTLTNTPNIEYLSNTTCVYENDQSPSKSWFVAQAN